MSFILQISEVKLDRCKVWSHTEGFLHKLSLTNAGVKIHLKLKLEGETYQRIFRYILLLLPLNIFHVCVLWNNIMLFMCFTLFFLSGKAERLTLKDQTVIMDVASSITQSALLPCLLSSYRLEKQLTSFIHSTSYCNYVHAVCVCLCVGPAGLPC